MNDTPSAAGPTARRTPSADLVEVVLGACSPADADTVFRALGARFVSDRGHGTRPLKTRTGPDTWTGAFLVSRSEAPLPDASLTGSVTAELQGGPVAVGRLRETLASAFAVEATGSVSGDQEVDVQLCLTTAAEGGRTDTGNGP